MWKTLKPYVLVTSAALNVAFVAIWIVHAAAPGRIVPAPPRDEAIGCPLHRRLNVSPQQWAVIEPRLKAFQASVGQLCGQVDAMRLEVIDMLAGPAPDLETIRAKQDELLATRREIQAMVVDHLLAEKSTLTPDRQTALFEMLRQRAGCGGKSLPMSGRGRMDTELRTLNSEQRK